MSYSGTVRCTQCYQRGHNKRTCPELRKLAAADPGGYYDQQVKRFEAQAATPRKCSYCKETGHTRRTCSTLKGNKNQAIRDTVLFRRAIKKWAGASGIGPGALITSRRSFYGAGTYTGGLDPDQKPRVFMITNFHWDELEREGALPGERGCGNQNILRAKSVGCGSEVWFGLPHVPTVAPGKGESRYQNRSNTDGHAWTVGAPAPMVAQPPAGFTGTSAREKAAEWFASDLKNESFQFREITDEQRKGTKAYLASSESLPSELKS